MPAFIFQEDQHTFRDIARLTRGAYCRFDPGAARQLLAELLRASGGLCRWRIERTRAGAIKLLEQIK